MKRLEPAGAALRRRSRWLSLPKSYSYGGETHTITEENRREVERAILDGQEATRPYIDAVQVIRSGARRISLSVRGGLRAGQRLNWRLSAVDQDMAFNGTARTAPRALRRQTLRIRLPKRIEAGYWRLQLSLPAPHTHGPLSQTIIATPSSCYMPDALPSRRILAVQLYSVRSGRNHGIGDFTDLRALLSLAHRTNFGFVALNPLHAVNPARPEERSPYSPDSRKFLNPLYLDIERIEGFRDPGGPSAWLSTAPVQQEISDLRQAGLIDYKRVAALKLSVAAWAFTQAWKHRDNEYAAGFLAWLKAEGPGALAFSARQPALADLPVRQEIAGALDLHRWSARKQQLFYLYLQFESARQFEAAIRSTPDIGVVTDLAIGAAATAADVDAQRELYCANISIGAPPDALAPQGQCWQLPPYNPVALRKQGYAEWIAILRRNMPAGGAIRIDHILGLMRQYWILDSRSPQGGAYVALPAHEFMAVLAVESHRNRCIVAGEDLGVVPRGLRTVLRKQRILGFEVLQLNCLDPDTRIRRNSVIISLNTHDLPTFKAFWDGADIVLKRRLGLTDDRSAEKAAASRQAEKRRLLNFFTPASPEAGDSEETDLPSDAALHILLHRMTQAAGDHLFQMIMLDDLCGETSPVNLPGTIDEYPNWSRKLSRTIEELYPFLSIPLPAFND